MLRTERRVHDNCVELVFPLVSNVTDIGVSVKISVILGGVRKNVTPRAVFSPTPLVTDIFVFQKYQYRTLATS